MSPSRFETIVEIREDWIPLHAHIPSIHHNLHHDRRDKVENKKKTQTQGNKAPHRLVGQEGVET